MIVATDFREFVQEIMRSDLLRGDSRKHDHLGPDHDGRSFQSQIEVPGPRWERSSHW